MTNVVRLNQPKTENVITALEFAIERARAGMIDGFVMVESGRDEIGGAVMTRLSSHIMLVEESTAMLAVAGGLDFLKADVIDSLEI